MSVETPPQLPHLSSVQALRGLAALGVLLSHLHVIELKYSPDALLGAWSRAGMAGVDLFFVISGFLMVYVTWGRDTKPGAFLWRRVTRIYPLYWVVSAAVLVVWLVRPDMVFASNPDPDILRSFLLFPQNGGPLLTVGWTLVYEMYFYLVFALVLMLPRGLMGAALVMWCVGVVALSRLARDPEGALLRLVLDPLMLEFAAGAGLGLAAAMASRALLGLVCAALGAVFAGYLILVQPELVDLLDDRMARAAVIGSAAAGLFAVCVVMAKLTPGRMAVWLGDISYSLYLTHVLTLSLVGRLAAPLMREGWTDNAVLLIVLVGASVGVAQLTYVGVERPLIAFFRRRRAARPASAAR